MIPVIRLVQSLRFALREMQGTTVSDYELIETINQAASLLYSQFSAKFVLYGLKKKIIITDSNGEAALPSDFVSIHQVGMGDEGVAVPTSYLANVEGTYRIIGDMFYAPEGVYSIEYYYVPKRVTSLSDNLDAPLAMSPYLEQIALALYGNNVEKATQIVLLCMQGLAAREHSHFENVGPVQVLGGRL
ncbi:MAG: hypothetical protein IJS42_03595 [Synergistaceae bacterium]|nr:hypothetical protein [Synergistaceae bacterium]